MVDPMERSVPRTTVELKMFPPSGNAAVLGTNLVDIGNEGASALLNEIQQSMTIEVDPDEKPEL